MNSIYSPDHVNSLDFQVLEPTNQQSTGDLVGITEQTECYQPDGAKGTAASTGDGVRRHSEWPNV